jgi:anti-sigma factor RsiW
MSDPNNDWLDEELAKLDDIEAPATLLPKVMEEVRKRAARPWWVRSLGLQTALWRPFVLAISALVFGFSLVVNPLQIASHIPGVIALMDLVPILLDATKAALVRAKIFNYPVLPLLAMAVTFSYVLLVASASAIQRLAGVRK